MIYFEEITEDNFEAVVAMKSNGEGRFISSNLRSLAQAWLYRENNDGFPKAVYADDIPVGFILFDEDLPERELLIWRLMIDIKQVNRGYGSEALRLALRLAKENGRFDRVKINYVIGNETAKHTFEKCGFLPTGEIENGEVVLEYRL